MSSDNKLDIKNIDEDLETKSKKVWETIKTYADLKNFYKGLILNDYVSPWYDGKFFDPTNPKTDNSYLTIEFVNKFFEINNLNFLTEDSRIELFEKDKNTYYCQKAYICGWIDKNISDKFLNLMNSQFNIVAFYANIRDENKDTKEIDLKLGTSWTISNGDIEFTNTFILLKQSEDPVYSWGNLKNIKKLYKNLRYVKVINTNYMDKQGSLLDTTIKILRNLK